MGLSVSDMAAAPPLMGSIKARPHHQSMAGRFVAAPPPASWGRGDGGYGLPMRNSQAVSGVAGAHCHMGGAEVAWRSRASSSRNFPEGTENYRCQHKFIVSKNKKERFSLRKDSVESRGDGTD